MRVNFVGGGPSYKDVPDNGEIWSCTDLYCFVPNATRWFQLHDRKDIDKHIVRTDISRNHTKELRELGIPIYMQKHYNDIPNSIEYPKEILKKYPKWFTNSICYMFPLAIEEGFTEIGLYGMDMTDADEFIHEIPAIAKWIGYCEAKGIGITIPESSVLKNHDYYYAYDNIERKKHNEIYFRCYSKYAPSVLKWMNEYVIDFIKKRQHDLVRKYSIKKINNGKFILDNSRLDEFRRELEFVLNEPIEVTFDMSQLKKVIKDGTGIINTGL